MKKLLLTTLIILAGIGIAYLVFATDSGALSPQTMADDDTVGTVAWSNPDNAKVSDNVYATTVGSNFHSHYLKATNFGFSIPTDATITGIVTEHERKASLNDSNTIADWTVRIVKSDGTFGTTNKADTIPWPTTESYHLLGSSSDLWGETWTPTDINDADFGIAIATTANNGPITGYVDHIRITVFFSTPSGGQHIQIKSGKMSIQQGRLMIQQ